MKKVIFLSISILIGVLVYSQTDEIIIPTDAIRVRIIANSDSVSDLYAKKKLKEEIKSDLYNLVKDANNSIDARENITSNMDMIKNLVAKRTSDFKINYGKNYFPKKVYKGVVYKEGEYESLVITLGKGLGENWWCVLYPPICMIEDNDSTSDVQYRSFVLDMLEN